MWIIRLRKVRIALAAVGVMVIVLGGLAILGRISTVPEDERITVLPTSEESEGVRLNEPTPEENPVVMPLPATDEPQELAASVAQVMGSPDTARFKEEFYVATIASAAPEIPNEGAEPVSRQEWAQRVVTTAWESDPWEERAKYKTTDTFTAQTVRAVEAEAFLEFFAPETAEDSAEAREYLTDEGLVVMEVEGTLVRELTDPEDGVRKQDDLGTVTWTVAMLCAEGEYCEVFLVVPGSLSQAEEEG